MISTLLFSTALLFFQDEAEYPLLMAELRLVVQQFMEPGDGVVLRPLPYWERAMRISKEVERFEPTSTRELNAAHQLIAGMIRLTTGDIREATAEFQHGIRVEPNQAPMFHYALGLCASAAQQYDVSEKEFKLAADGAPHWASPRTARAAVFLELGRVKEAEALLRESLDLNLTDVDAVKSRQYLLLAQLLDAQNKPKDAEAALRSAVELDTQNPMLADYLGIHLLNTVGREAASQVWKSASVVFGQNPQIAREIALIETGLQVAEADTFKSPARAQLTEASPRLPGGARFRAYRIQAKARDVLKLRADSRAFQPFIALLGTDGRAVAMQNIRSSSFSVLEYRVNTPGTYYLIVGSYSPDQTGEFTAAVSR